jgi:hypothetical protein
MMRVNSILRAALAATLLLVPLVRAQEPEPPPPPPPVEEPVTETPTTQEPQPAEGTQPAEGNQAPRRGRGRGRGGQDPKNDHLPEFTPVAAPSLEALAGKQYFWFTVYPDFLCQFDPVTDTLVKKVQLQHGLFWSTTLTHDRKRMLVVTDQQQSIEVVDLAAGTVTSAHPFREDGFVLRIQGVRECPGGVHWLVSTTRIKKEIDRYSFEPNQWLLYDSQNKKVVRKMAKLPEALERGTEISADGTHWVGQDREGNVRFLDGRTFEELGTIDLRTPRYFGAGAIRLTGTDLYDGRDPTRARMLFTTTDPVESRRTSWGVVELDLENRRVLDVQEWGPSQQSWGLRVAHKKRVGAAMGGGFGGRGDERTRLTVYDLETGKKLAEAFEHFRPRRSLVAIAPEGDKIYIGTAGSDFEVFTIGLQRLKTVELDGEVVGRIHVVDG